MGDVQRVKKVMGERGINSEKLLHALWLKKTRCIMSRNRKYSCP